MSDREDSDSDAPEELTADQVSSNLFQEIH